MENLDLVWGATICILLLVYLIRKNKQRKANLIVVASAAGSLFTGFVILVIAGLVTALFYKH